MAGKHDNDETKKQNSENPFGEEFSPEDVVNTGNADQESISAQDDAYHREEMDESSETREESGLSEKYRDAEKNIFDEEQNRLNESFRDFMTLPKIAGTSKSYSHTNHIPEESLEKRYNKVQISDDPEFNEDNHGRSTVIVNRNENDEITSIEVHCKCGERTKIYFDYEKESAADDEENSGFKENIPPAPAEVNQENSGFDDEEADPPAEDLHEDDFPAENTEEETGPVIDEAENHDLTGDEESD